ncbi:MAG: hypothetical protein ABIS44_05840 [Mycobacteriales bacterium]
MFINGADSGPIPLVRWLGVAAGAVAVSALVSAIERRGIAQLRGSLVLLTMTALPRAGQGTLGAVTASVLGVLLFLVAHFAYTACEQPALPASYAGGEVPPRRWPAIAAIVAGSAAADAALFALLDLTRAGLTDTVVLGVLGMLSTGAIAGVIAVLALRTPPLEER